MIKQGDCLELMKELPDDSVDMILVDLPYNLTDCAWDKSAIDLAELWTQFKRILKPCCSAVLFASGKFTHKLIASNLDWYKYKWIWIKNAPTMFVHAKNAPMRKFEEICVFSDGVINHASVSKRRMKYNPQSVVPCEILKDNSRVTTTQVRNGAKGFVKTGANATKTQIHNPPPENTYTQTHTNYPSDVIYFEEDGWRKNIHGGYDDCGNRLHVNKNGKRFGGVVGERPSRPADSYYIQEQTGYPSDVLTFDAEPNNQRLHPTQKPVPLLEYLIRTYTDEGEVVLDATMGSGSTGVACVNTRRRFIGFELEQKFFDIAQKRIAKAVVERAQSLF